MVFTVVFRKKFYQLGLRFTLLPACSAGLYMLTMDSCLFSVNHSAFLKSSNDGCFSSLLPAVYAMRYIIFNIGNFSKEKEKKKENCIFYVLHLYMRNNKLHVKHSYAVKNTSLVLKRGYE